MNEPFFQAFLGSVATIVVGLIGYFGIVKRTAPEETAIALAAWKDLLEPLQAELREAKQEISLLRQTIEASEKRHQEREKTHKAEQARLMKRIKELEEEVKRSQQ